MPGHAAEGSRGVWEGYRIEESPSGINKYASAFGILK